MKKKILCNKDGSVLLICLLILLVLTLIGIQALDTTDVELAITTNDRTYKEALNAADGGGYVAIKTISEALNNSESPSLPSTINYIANDGSVALNPPDPDTFYREIIGLDSYENEQDLAFSMSPSTEVCCDIKRLRVVNFAGGGAEFAASYSGVGASGPKGAYYRVSTNAEAPNGSCSRVDVTYIKALGVAGGL
jgi:hypothetical protein